MRVVARRVDVPDRVLQMGLLDRIDYGDAFVVAVPDEPGRAPEHYAESAMADAPALVRGIVRVAHRWVLGLQLRETDPPAPIPGWHLMRRDPDAVVYGVGGGLITPRIVVLTRPGEVVLATVMRYDHPAAPAVTAVVAPVHRAVARLLLDRGARLAAGTVRGRRR